MILTTSEDLKLKLCYKFSENRANLKRTIAKSYKYVNINHHDQDYLKRFSSISNVLADDLINFGR